MRWPDCIPVREGASGARLDPFRPGVNLFSRRNRRPRKRGVVDVGRCGAGGGG